MQDLDKHIQIKELLASPQNTIEYCESGPHSIYFDYAGVIGLLEQAQTLVTESARCPRPADLPPGLPWSERLYNGDDLFDPYVFDGSMSIEDYEKMHELMAGDDGEGMEP